MQPQLLRFMDAQEETCEAGIDQVQLRRLDGAFSKIPMPCGKALLIRS